MSSGCRNSSLHMRFKSMSPEVVFTNIPDDCSFTQQCLRRGFKLERSQVTVRQGVTDSITEDVCIMAIVGGCRARARAKKLAEGNCGKTSTSSGRLEHTSNWAGTPLGNHECCLPIIVCLKDEAIVIGSLSGKYLQDSGR